MLLELYQSVVPPNLLIVGYSRSRYRSAAGFGSLAGALVPTLFNRRGGLS